MNIFAYLIQSHRRIKQLMEHIVVASTVAERHQLFNTLVDMLRSHEEAEEAMLYEVLQNFSSVKEMIDDAHDDHDEINAHIATLLSLPGDHEKWMGHFQTLRYSVQYHIWEEETRLFAKAKHLLPKNKIAWRGHVEAPREEAIRIAA